MDRYFGPGVTRKYHPVGGRPPGHTNEGEHEAPALKTLLREGFPARPGK
jgi:hypothetical protein